MVRQASGKAKLCCLTAFVAVVCAASGLTSSAAAQQDSADSILTRARAQRERHEFRTVVHTLTTGISLYPKDFRLYGARGYAYNRLEKYKEALADYNMALASPDPHVEWYFQRGWAYDQLTDFARASADYEKYLSFCPRDGIAMCCLADNLCEMGQTERAMKVLNKAIEIDPGSLQAHRLRGMLRHGKNGDERAAIADFNIVCGAPTYEHYGDTLGYRAAAYKQIKDYGHALADYTTLIKLSPRDDNLRRQRAGVYELMGNYQKAVEDYTAAIDLAQTESAPSYAARAQCYEKLGKKDLARKDLAKSKKLKDSGDNLF
jgi:tetratricopeptide (TPR) repeat protein